MRRTLFLFFLGFSLSLFAACGRQEVPTEAPQEEPQEQVATATETALPPTETTAPTETPIPPTETAAPTDTPSPTATAELVADACVECHSDQQQLIDTAAPEEEKEPSESSGVG